MQRGFRELLDKSDNLPTLPAIAIKVLELTRQEEAPMAEVVKTISSDPALSAKILRTVNSSFYGLRRRVTSVAHAISLLGLKVVKNLALGFSLVQDCRGGPGCSFDYEAFWRSSLFGAVAAKQLGSRIRSELGEDIFFVGLFQDIGVLALNRCMAELYGQVQKKREQGVCLDEAERQVLGFDHMEAGGYLAEKWNLPESFYLPIAYHHRPEQLPQTSLEITALTRLLYVSANIIDFFSKQGISPEVLETITVAGETLGLFKREEVDGLMINISAEGKALASLFDLDMSNQKSYTQILEEANAELGKASISLERALTDQVRVIQELKEMVYVDSLTGLLNRKSFDETLDKELYRAKRYNRPLALILGDLDHFKDVNDKYGHLVGDSVLRKVSTAVREKLRESDTTFRYGGEEFAVILPETESRGAMIVAERFRQLVEQLLIVEVSCNVKVTISLGVAAVSSDRTITKEELIAAADAALYQAKTSGRNRCCLAASGIASQPGHRAADQTALH